MASPCFSTTCDARAPRRISTSPAKCCAGSRSRRSTPHDPPSHLRRLGLSDDKPQRPRLGRGLSALLGDNGSDYAALDAVRESKTVPVEYLRPNRFQPRREFDEDELDSLADSIREQGILQPILVRR